MLGSKNEFDWADVYNHIGRCYILSGDAELARYFTQLSESIMSWKPVPDTMILNRLNRLAIDLYDGYQSQELRESICQWAYENDHEQVIHLLNLVESQK